MSTEDKELVEMREWFREVKTGGRLIKVWFSVLLAIGGAYLMVKQIFYHA